MEVLRGSPIPKSKNREFIPKSRIDKKVKNFAKTKNDHEDIKWKINHNLFPDLFLTPKKVTFYKS